MKFSLGKPEPLFIADDFYDENRRSCRLFLLYKKLLRNVPIKQKTLREDATRCIWNMSAIIKTNKWKKVS